MSALIVYQGLEERFRTVPGLRNVILGEPTATHDLPCLYTALADFERPAEGHPPSDNLTEMTYRFTHRLMIRWQDRPEAEEELLSFVNSIPYAVSEDAKLSGRLPKGMARISDGTAGFVTLGGVAYRILDFTSEVLEKAPRSTGL